MDDLVFVTSVFPVNTVDVEIEVHVHVFEIQFESEIYPFIVTVVLMVS